MKVCNTYIRNVSLVSPDVLCFGAFNNHIGDSDVTLTNSTLDCLTKKNKWLVQYICQQHTKVISVYQYNKSKSNILIFYNDCLLTSSQTDRTIMRT